MTTKAAKWYAWNVSHVVRSIEIDEELANTRKGAP